MSLKTDTLKTSLNLSRPQFSPCKTEIQQYLVGPAWFDADKKVCMEYFVS